MQRLAVGPGPHPNNGELDQVPLACGAVVERGRTVGAERSWALAAGRQFVQDAAERNAQPLRPVVQLVVDLVQRLL